MMATTISTTNVKRLWFFLPLAVLLYTYLLFFRDALIDDTFITLNYVQTLSSSGLWGFYPIHISNTATSPLNVILLSLVTLVVRSPIEAVFWLTLIEWLVIAYLLLRIGEALSLRWFAPIAFFAFVANPLLMSSLGLETILFSTLIVAGLYFFLVRRFDACAVATGLLTITRPDGILFFAVIAFFLPGWHVRSRTLLVYILTLLPWHLYSWVNLGSFIPDTFLIKLRQSWGDISFGDGWQLYLKRYPIEVCLSAIMLPPALLSFFKPTVQVGSIIWILWLYGLLHFGAYTLISVPPYHWYYAPQVICAILLGSLAIAKLYMCAQENWQRIIATVLVSVGLVVPVAGTGYLLVARGAPIDESFIHTNHATPNQYRSIGEYIAEHHAGEVIVRNRIETSTVAYYCDCYLIDTTFNMRDWLVEDVERFRNGTSLLDRIWQINFYFFKPSTPFPATTSRLNRVPKSTAPNPNLQHWYISSSWKKDQQLIELDDN